MSQSFECMYSNQVMSSDPHQLASLRQQMIIVAVGV